MGNVAAAGTRIGGLVVVSALALSPVAGAATLRGSVLRVMDGDTVQVKVGERARTLDLAGVDAPEPSACFGREAKARLAKLLGRGKRVVVRTGRGRSAEVLAGRTNVNRSVVRSGHALARAGGGRLGAQLREDEASARSKGLGLHKACATGTPAPGTTPPPATSPPAGTSPPTAAPGDVTGQAAIDQMTAELKDMAFQRFTSGYNSTSKFRLDLCGDRRFRYYTEDSYSSDGTFFNTRHEYLGNDWRITEAVIKPNGDRGAVVKGTITSHATSTGPGSVDDPNAEAVLENIGGQWYWNRQAAQAGSGVASCDPILQH